MDKIIKNDEKNNPPKNGVKNTNLYAGQNIVPFETVEEVWFWFIQAQQARVDGARYSAGLSLTPRPCEPSDILTILNNLYRNRLLLWEHLLVLRYYGRRQLPPNQKDVKRKQACKLWHEAMNRLEPIFIRKGIMEQPQTTNGFAHQQWARDAIIHSSSSVLN